MEDHLRPAFIGAKNNNEKVTIVLDGVKFGYPTSFLEEAFGGLAREFGIDDVADGLVLVANVEPLLVEEIHRYIQEANRLRPDEQQ